MIDPEGCRPHQKVLPKIGFLRRGAHRSKDLAIPKSLPTKNGFNHATN